MIKNQDLPIVFFDIESTGTDPQKDRIIQIYMRKVFKDDMDELHFMINPIVPIPQEATEVHGINNDMVEHCENFDYHAQEIFQFLDGSHLGGHNIMNFDVPILQEEFARIGVKVWPDPNIKFFDTMKLFQHILPRDLKTTYEFFTSEVAEEERMHDASYDTFMSFQAFKSMIQNDLQDYDLLDISAISFPDDNIDFAGKLKCDEDGYAVYNFGKSKGFRVIDDPGFSTWMLKNNFTSDTKIKLRAIIANGGKWL